MKHLDNVSKKLEILENLVKHQAQEITSRTLQKETKISPRILQRHLKELEDQKLVRIRFNQNWQFKSQKDDNRPHLISITTKGLKYFSSQSVTNLNNICKKLQAITDGLITPERLDQWKQATVWKPNKDFDTRGITDTTEEDGCTITMLKPAELKEMLDLKEAITAPLNDFLREILKRLIKIEGTTGISETLENVAFKFDGSGRINTIVDAGIPSGRISGIDW